MTSDELPEEVQQRMMEKLIGKANVQRMAKATGRFRPMPVTITYEFYQIGTWDSNWRIDRIENGHKEPHKPKMTEHECRLEVTALRDRGFAVRPVTIGFRPGKGQRRNSSNSRKAIINKLRDFKA